MELRTIFPAGLTGAALRDRLAGQTGGKVRGYGVRGDGIRGDGDLTPQTVQVVGPYKPAAVLVPIVMRPEPTLLLTQRTDHLPHHPGQISFPGGRIEPEDAHPEAAALREAWEEIGLDPAAVELLGRLDAYRTVTAYEVTPVVALIHPPFDLALDAHEVADAFEVPLAFLIDRRNHERRGRETPTGRRDYWAMPWGERFIWGATAGMLVNLTDVLVGPSAP
jgi:8-oxo-dGTP pyrophosphatase MutT (NUDIX family)